MSYWKDHVGPYWSHVFQTLNPFASGRPGILNADMTKWPATIQKPLPGEVFDCGPQHAHALAEFLKKEYIKFPKSQVMLTAERIRQGFQLDNWMGVGFRVKEDIIGCVIGRPLGTLLISYQEIPNADLVDFFCVAQAYRKKGLASFLLQEFTRVTAAAGRLVHVFQQEGGFFRALPPLYQGKYIWRKRGLPHEGASYLRKMDISERVPLGDMTHLKFINEDAVRNRPSHMTGDSEIYIFQYRYYTFYMCITNTFHWSKPEQWKMGEILWIQAAPGKIPQDIQRLAVETLVDHCNYDIVLMDSSYPYDPRKGWKKDSNYSWHITNFNPGRFFDVKPFLVL